MPAATTYIPITEMPEVPELFNHIISFNNDPKNTDPLVKLLEKLPDTLEDISNINFDINNVQPSCSNTSQMKIQIGQYLNMYYLRMSCVFHKVQMKKTQFQKEEV